MKKQTKQALFDRMLELEHLAQETTFDGVDYASKAEGMFEALTILGIEDEYLDWAYGK